MVHLTSLVVLVVHPIDTAAHPAIPAGHRWAVMLGEGPFSDLNRCPNAGWCPGEDEAMAEGEMVAVTVVKALRAFGVPAEYRVVRTPTDPIPPGGDFLSPPVTQYPAGV